MNKTLLTEDGEFEGVHFGLPEGLVGGVAGEGDVPVHVGHSERQGAIRVPAT